MAPAVLILRDYQEEAVQAHYDFFSRYREPDENPIIVVPTGGGKSLIIAEFLKRSLRLWPKTRFIVLTHVRELIRQNYDEFVGHWGGGFLEPCPAGIYSAGLNRRDRDCRVLFAGIQSVWTLAGDLGHFDVVLVDECHLIPKRGQGRYLTCLSALRKINPRLRVVGYTATHYRLDGGYLHRGPDRMFSRVAYEVRVEMLIERGHLAPLVAKKMESAIDASDVRVSSTGDYVVDELEAAAMADGCVDSAVAEMVSYARASDRRSWLVFAIGKAHAAEVVDRLESYGVRAETVFGDTPREQRDDRVARFKSGALRCLVNVGVLTTGFNAPRCDLMAIMRPTQSASLYVQMMGRGMRTHPGKRDCLVLDYGENVARHGPINAVRPKSAGSEDGGVMPTKACPECRSILPLGVQRCPECGHEWEAAEIRAEHARVASALCPIDLTANRPRVRTVDQWFLRRHEKDKGATSLRVDYQCGTVAVSEWVCLEHEGYAQRKATRWWLAHGAPPVPATVDEAIRRESELQVPLAIEVIRDGEYDRVLRPLFDLASIMTDDHDSAAAQ